MSRRKHGRPAELVAGQVKITLMEQGVSGLKGYGGFITEAYNAQLYWPSVYKLYSRIRRSMPEIVMVRQAFSSWARNVKIDVVMPENPTDDDKRYHEFMESVFTEIEGGFGRFMDTLINNVPFYGWGWFTIVPGRRDKNANQPDEWVPESDDGLIGLRRLAWRDPSSFYKWEMDDNMRVLGMWQIDVKGKRYLLPSDESLHLTFGDPNNPEGLSPLEAVWRLERIKYGLEIVQGIGFEHAAGYLNVKKTEQGTLSADDIANVGKAAAAILTAQEGNYAAWPFGIDGQVMDVSFSAAPSLLEAIKYYGVLALSCFTMQWMALSATTGAGSYAAMQDSSSMGVFTFNAMLDGFAAQLDAQVGKKLYEWNKTSFPNLTTRPVLSFSHIEKETALSEMSQFMTAMKDILPIGEEDLKAIRSKVSFLPNSLPEAEEPEAQPDQQQQNAYDVLKSVMDNTYRATR